MAQSKAKSCLFRFFVLQLLIVGLSAGQLAASVLVDAHSDLEEVQRRHDIEQRLADQFAGKLETESFWETDCLFFERNQDLHSKSELIPSLTRSLRNEDLNPGQSDESVAAVSEQQEIEGEQSDVARHHIELLRNRPVWETVSEFVAAQRKSLDGTVRFAKKNFAGFYHWADQQIDAAQTLALGDIEKAEQLGRSVTILQPQSAIEIPMFLVRDSKANKLETPTLAGFYHWAQKRLEAAKTLTAGEGQATESQTTEQAAQVIALNDPQAAIEIPMFEVADAETAQADAASDSIELASEQGKSNLPDDLFAEETQLTCDRWGVGFAKQLLDIESAMAEGANSSLNLESSKIATGNHKQSTDLK